MSAEISQIEAILSSVKSSGDIRLQDEIVVSVVKKDSLSDHCWLGYDSGGNVVIYFEIDNATGTNFWVSQVISLEFVETRLFPLERNITAIKITCHNHALEQLFIFFIANLLQQISSKKSLVDTVQRVASGWRELLNIAQNGFPDSAAIGLFGELQLLDVLTEYQGNKAIEAWQRTAKDLHDFIF